MKREWLIAWLLAAGMFCGTHGIAAAAPVSFRMQGTITASEAIPGFDVGSPVRARFTFDSDEVEFSPSTPGGDYRLRSFRLEIPSMGIDFARSGAMGFSAFSITDETIGVDAYLVALDLGLEMTAGPFTLFEFDIVLRDSTATALSSENVLVMPPALDDFDDVFFQLRASVFPFGGEPEARGTIDSLTLLPIPGTPALILAGLCGFLGIRMRCRTLDRPRPDLEPSV